MKFRTWYWVVLILIIASALRLWQLGAIPRGFHVDEASYGYNAYSILKTRRDEYGAFLPLILRSFNDYKGAVYAYLTIPFIAVAGLTEWAVRAPSAVFGVLFVLLTYGIVFQMSRKRDLAIIASGLAAVSPLGILLSRVQSDPLVSFVLFYFALYAWLLWFEKRHIWTLGLFGLSLLMSFYTYAVTRLIALPFFCSYLALVLAIHGRKDPAGNSCSLYMRCTGYRNTIL